MSAAESSRQHADYSRQRVNRVVDGSRTLEGSSMPICPVVRAPPAPWRSVPTTSRAARRSVLRQMRSEAAMALRSTHPTSRDPAKCRSRHCLPRDARPPPGPTHHAQTHRVGSLASAQPASGFGQKRLPSVQRKDRAIKPWDQTPTPKFQPIQLLTPKTLMVVNHMIGVVSKSTVFKPPDRSVTKASSHGLTIHAIIRASLSIQRREYWAEYLDMPASAGRI